MEDSAIIVAIIAAVASVFGALFSYFSNRYNSKADKTTNILEEQYLKVISPIHQILHMSFSEDVYSEVYAVIKDNYHLLPNQLLDDFFNSEKVIKEATNTNDLISTPFGERIEEFYKILRYKLHYSTIKISKKEKESVQLLAYSKPNISALIFSFALFFGFGLLIFLLVDLFVTLYFQNSSHIIILLYTINSIIAEFVLLIIFKKN